MQEIKRFQIRGVPGEVVRTRFNDRIVDYWAPRGGSEHLLIAHDGQNVFDGTTSTHRRQTWKMAQTAIDVANKLGTKPPAIVAVWHSATKDNPWGRAKDLAPQKFFTPETYVDPRWAIKDPSVVLHADSYLEQIFDQIVPAIHGEYTPRKYRGYWFKHGRIGDFVRCDPASGQVQNSSSLVASLDNQQQ